MTQQKLRTLSRRMIPLVVILLVFLLESELSILGKSWNQVQFLSEPKNHLEFDALEAELYMHEKRLSILNSTTLLFVGFRAGVIPSFFQEAFGSDIQLATNASDQQRVFSSTDGGDIVFSEGVLCGAIKAFRDTGGIKKHLMLAGLNENWGAFSSEIPGRTAEWGEWISHWTREGCDMDDLDFYINHENVTAIFTTTHQNAIKPHSKVLAMAIGVSNADAIAKQLHTFPMVDRTKLLMVNMAKSETRTAIFDRIKPNFNGAVENTFGKDTNAFFAELRESKFILCPSGIGWDTYRSWEAIALGAIPILEKYYREDGFFKVYDNLPVLWVDHYDEVTPALLEEAYPKIMSKYHEYKFEKLTKQWWIDRINAHRPSSKLSKKLQSSEIVSLSPHLNQKPIDLKTYDEIPTIKICDVMDLEFNSSRNIPFSGIDLAYIPSNGTSFAYGPYITKASSTTIIKALKKASNNAPPIDISSTPDEILKKYRFFSVIRHPMQRVLSGIHQFEVFWILNWVAGKINQEGLTWWNKTCLNSTWGSDTIRELPCQGTQPITTTESRLQRLNDFLDDITNRGFFDQHIAPMTHLIRINKIHPYADYFDIEHVSNIVQAICDASGKKEASITVHMPRGNLSNGMDWVIFWDELVNLSLEHELAKNAMSKMCHLYRNDVECLPYDVPECAQFYDEVLHP
mmetsp:Transcript_25754/g.54721  ORF Transcript_25754/g.54721 Transcript_25754/m.54721 type:complete len:685 (+) Transcript_25754:69-2123(+)